MYNVSVLFNKNTTTIQNVLLKPEAVTQRCFVKRVFSDLKKRLQACNFIEKETLAQHRCFPVNFAKFVITFFLQNNSGGCFWKTFSFYLKRLLFLRLRRFWFFGIRKFEKHLLSRALVDGWFRFFLTFSWIFTKAIQILKRQSKEISW